MGWQDDPVVQQAKRPAWADDPVVGQQGGEASVAVDMLRSIPGGLGKGIAATVGGAGDLRSLADWAIPEGKAKEFLKKNVLPALPGSELLQAAPTSAQINKAISAPFGGYYKPQTIPGQYAETVASFAPSAVMPGSMAQRAARVVMPAVASETAGQFAKGSKYEPLSRAGGALVGGLAQGVGEAMLAHRAAAKTVMSAAELSKAKDEAYKAAESAGVVIRGDAWQRMAGDIKAELAKKPLRADLHGNAVSALDTIASETGDVTLESADAVRQVVNDAIEAASNTNGGDLRRASKIKSMLDDFLDGMDATDTLAGDAKVAVPILKEARSLAQREFKAKEIQKLIDLAENSAGSNYSASGLEQALRVQFKGLNARLIKDPSLAKSFTQSERAAITKVVQGGKLENAMRLLGKLAPTNNISITAGSGIGAGLGFALGGPAGAGAGAAALPIVAGLARSGASAMTKNNAQNALTMMRATPATQSLLMQTPRIPESLLPALLSQGANR